jgi:hypothetical protein
MMSNRKRKKIKTEIMFAFVQRYLNLWIQFLCFFFPSLSFLKGIKKSTSSVTSNNSGKHPSSGVSSLETSIPTVSYYDCISFLDDKLLSLSSIECRELFQLIYKINYAIFLLKELSLELRNNGINLSAQQSARILKLSDLINSLQFIIYPLPIFTSGNGPSQVDGLPHHLSIATPSPAKGAKEPSIAITTDEAVLNYLYYYNAHNDATNHLSSVMSASPGIASSPSLLSTGSSSAPGSGTTPNPVTFALPSTTSPGNSAVNFPMIHKPVNDLKCLVTSLPDLEYLSYFLSKTKHILKTVDEMSNSKKNDNLKFKFSGKKTLYSLISQYSSSSTSTSGRCMISCFPF